jgi:hypothetical protein
VSHARTLWEEGREPGRQVIALGLACTLTAVVLELVIGDRLGLLFDACFVLICLALALRVRPSDFFTVGVLPPLLMLAVFVLLAVVSPTAIAEADDSAIQAVVSGLATHAGALILGYALCLATLAMRQRVLAGRAAARAAASPRVEWRQRTVSLRPEPEPTDERDGS